MNVYLREFALASSSAPGRWRARSRAANRRPSSWGWSLVVGGLGVRRSLSQVRALYRSLRLMDRRRRATSSGKRIAATAAEDARSPAPGRWKAGCAQRRPAVRAAHHHRCGALVLPAGRGLPAGQVFGGIGHDHARVTCPRDWSPWLTPTRSRYTPGCSTPWRTWYCPGPVCSAAGVRLLNSGRSG